MDVNKMGSTSNTKDGNFVEIFLTADIDTWVYINQVSSEEGDSLTTGFLTKEWGDIHIISERRTFAQTPFKLRFPTTITVKSGFTVASPVTVISAVVSQESASVNFDPDLTGGETFTTVDVTVRIQSQYPYAARHIADPDAATTVTVDDNPNVEQIEFVSMTHPDSCAAVKANQLCTQDITMRVFPKGCSANASYQLEFWLKCYTRAPCPLDDKTGDVTSNSYIDMQFSTSGSGFCPELLDSYDVSAQFEIFHDELFTNHVKLTSEDSLHTEPVYANDWLYNKVSFFALSTKMEQDAQVQEVLDFVRATSIYLEVSISTGDLPITPQDVDGDLTNFVQTDDSTSFTLMMCSADSVPSGKNPADYDDCFNNYSYGNALQYMDLHPIYE